MTTLLPLASRRSRYLLDWSAAACLAAPDRSLNAITGQVATFSRNSIKRAMDANGVLRIVPHSRPAFQWATDPVSGLKVPGVLLEGASTNLAWQSEDWSATWAAIGTPTRVAAGDTASGISLDTIGDDAAGALEGYSQTVTFTGNAVKVISVFVKQGTATSSVVRLRDTTAGADRLLATITWAGPVPVVTMTTGTSLGAVAYYDGVYRIQLQSTAVTAANTNSLQFYPATTAALAIANTGTILAGGVQAEDAADCSSYIKTTTGTATRAVDALTIAFNALPQALTSYVKFTELQAAISTSINLVSVGTPAQNGSLLFYKDIGGPAYRALRYGTTLAAAGTTGFSPGAMVEGRAATTSAGALTAGISIANAAEVTGSDVSTRAPDPAFTSQTIYIGPESLLGPNGATLFHAVRVAAGAPTMTTLRAG